jgi:phosphopantothenoylcysteine decarboxylase / phosphopantothenate---cysteine ligase
MGPTHPADGLRGAHGSHLRGRVVALGVDGARGAAGAVRVARALLRLGAEVQALTAAATHEWVHPDALHYATGRAPVGWPDHAAFDAVLLAPAGPALVQKLRLGLPDTAPAAAALGHVGRAPVLVAPSPGTGAGALEGLGFRVAEGFDEHGEPHAEALAARVAGVMATGKLRDRRVLLVAGGALEILDAMRVVGTRGDAALARALRLELERRGAHVTALLGPAAAPHGRQERAYESRRDLGMMAALLGEHDLALLEDALPKSAPVKHTGKIPSGQAALALELHTAEPRDPLARAARTVTYRSEGRDAVAQAARIVDAAEAEL